MIRPDRILKWSAHSLKPLDRRGCNAEERR
jgi:hypothetical protein